MTTKPTVSAATDAVADAEKKLAEAKLALEATKHSTVKKNADGLIRALAGLPAADALVAAAAALRVAQDMGQKSGLKNEEIEKLVDEGRVLGKRVFIPAPPPPPGLSYKKGTPLNP